MATITKHQINGEWKDCVGEDRCRFKSSGVPHIVGNNTAEVEAGIEAAEQEAAQGAGLSSLGTTTKANDEEDLPSDFYHNHPHQKWGATPNLKEGSKTPWGEAQHVEKPAPGIAVVGTDGHGGVKLSNARNKAIPKPLRNSNAWYEEDVEAQIAGHYFPETFPHVIKNREAEQEEKRREISERILDADMSEMDEIRKEFQYVNSGREVVKDEFERTIKNYYPDEYTEVTGETLTEDDSYVLRERAKSRDINAFLEANKDNYVAENQELGSSLPDGEPGQNAWVPKGHYIARSVRAADDSTGYYLVKKEELYPRGMMTKTLAIDPQKHLDVTEAVEAGKAQFKKDKDDDEANKAPVAYDDEVSVNYDNLTEKQSDKVEESLNKKYRWAGGDGQPPVVQSRIERLKERGAAGKRKYWDGNKEAHFVYFSDRKHIMPVSSAEYKAIEVEDVTSDDSLEDIAYNKAEKSFRTAEDKKRSWDYLNAPYVEREKINKRSKNAEAKFKEIGERMSAKRAEAQNRRQEQTRAARDVATDIWENSLKQKFENM